MKTTLAFLIYLFTFAQALAVTGEFKGTAKSLDGKTVVYQERLTVTIDDATGLCRLIETNYLDSEGKPIGKIRSDFSRHPMIPDSEFEDFRFKRKETSKLSDDKKTVAMKVQVDGKTVSEKSHEVNNKMLVGQGFDNFLRANFVKLAKDSIVISFGVLAKADFYTFKAYQIEAKEERVQFGIKLDSFFLRMFVEELLIDYDPKTKRLLRYRGLSNLQTAKGGDQHVQIDYEY